jgi:hypothetical protein
LQAARRFLDAGFRCIFGQESLTLLECGLCHGGVCEK